MFAWLRRFKAQQEHSPGLRRAAGIAFLGAAVAAFVSPTPAQTPQHRFPSILTYASLNGIAPPESGGEWNFEATHLDMAHGSATDLQEIKKRNPAVFMVKYRLLETALVGTEERELEAFCRSRSLPVEDAYLHYSDDTQMKVPKRSYLVKGWGSGTASKRSESRMRTAIWGSERLVYNPGSPCVHQFMIARSLQDLSESHGGFHYDGIFIDEIGPPDWVSESGAPPPVLSGGRIAEYSNHTREEVSSAGLYLRDLVGLVNDISLALKSASGGHSLFYLNTASYNTAAIMQLGLAGDGLLTEGLSSEGASYSPRGEALLWDNAKKLASAEKIYVFTQANPNPPKGNFDSGNYPSPADRHEMYSLASYWMAKQGDSTYYSLRYRWQQVSSFWVKAQEYDIGEPRGDYYLWNENTSTGDSLHQKYRIYRRDYTKAVILFRTRYDWNEANNKDMSAKSETYDLRGTYRVLYSSGSLGPPVSQIALSLGEGVVLIPASAAGTATRSGLPELE